MNETTLGLLLLTPLLVLVVSLLTWAIFDTIVEAYGQVGSLPIIGILSILTLALWGIWLLV